MKTPASNFCIHSDLSWLLWEVLWIPCTWNASSLVWILCCHWPVCTVAAMDRAGLHQTPCCNLLQGHHHTIHCGGFNSLHSSPFRLLWCPELEQQVAEGRQESDVLSVGTSRGEWGGWQIRFSSEIKRRGYLITKQCFTVRTVCMYVCLNILPNATILWRCLISIKPADNHVLQTWALAPDSPALHQQD